jgi:hypothetical protein
VSLAPLGKIGSRDGGSSDATSTTYLSECSQHLSFVFQKLEESKTFPKQKLEQDRNEVILVSQRKLISQKKQQLF